MFKKIPVILSVISFVIPNSYVHAKYNHKKENNLTSVVTTRMINHYGTQKYMHGKSHWKANRSTMGWKKFGEVWGFKKWNNVKLKAKNERGNKFSRSINKSSCRKSDITLVSFDVIWAQDNFTKQLKVQCVPKNTQNKLKNIANILNKSEIKIDRPSAYLGTWKLATDNNGTKKLKKLIAAVQKAFNKRAQLGKDSSYSADFDQYDEGFDKFSKTQLVHNEKSEKYNQIAKAHNRLVDARNNLADYLSKIYS